MATTLIYIAVATVISIGASYIAMALNKPKDQQPIRDDRQPTLALRGSMVPILLGRRRVAPVFAWDGDEYADPIKVRSGKGFGGHRITGYTYYKGAMHLLCVGPVRKLYGIYENGHQVWPRQRHDPVGMTLDNVTTPSGSKVPADDQSFFYIYWGENDQPVNTHLGDTAKRMGVTSAWPGICYIEWSRKNLGATPMWGQLEYDIELTWDDSPLTGSTANLPVSVDIDNGVNPAHALWRVLTAPYPYGIGLSNAWLDGGAFEAMGLVCQTEHLPVNILARDGQDATEMIVNLMSEIGFFLTQVGRVLIPVMIRPAADPATVPVLALDEQVDPNPEVAQQHGDTPPTRYAFFVFDKLNNFKTTDVPIDDDAQARSIRKAVQKNFTLPDITDRVTGVTIAQRRMAEEAVQGVSYTLRVVRGARNLKAGQPFTIPALGGLRVASVKPAFDTTECVLEALVDQYGVRPHDYRPPDQSDPLNVIRSTGAAPDILVFADNLPVALRQELGITIPAIGVARIRANQNISGAEVWISGNGTSYMDAGSQNNYAAGGTMNRPLPATDPLEVSGVLDIGPTITTYNDDIMNVDDLTGNDAAWSSGDQICVIDHEWMFVRSVEATTGGWRLRGLMRAQYGTARALHAVNSPVIIFKKAQQAVFSGGMIQSGATIYIKTQPFTTNDIVDISTVTPVVVIVTAGTGFGVGSGSDAAYTHNQSTSAAVWNVNHNLNKYPSVMVVNSTGDEIFGNVHYVDLNNLTVTFSVAVSGKAYIN